MRNRMLAVVLLAVLAVGTLAALAPERSADAVTLTYADGYVDGYAVGYEEGYAAGLAAGKGATPSPVPAGSARKNAITPKPTATPRPTATPKTRAASNYIANTGTKKFHRPSCKSVKQMKESNKWYFTGTRDELIAKGYSPCKICNP